jgi:DNA-directed RNA polymerase subunit F
MEKTNYDPIYEAYKILVDVYQDDDAEESDLTFAIESAIGYLGEALA